MTFALIVLSGPFLSGNPWETGLYAAIAVWIVGSLATAAALALGRAVNAHTFKLIGIGVGLIGVMLVPVAGNQMEPVIVALGAYAGLVAGVRHARKRLESESKFLDAARGGLFVVGAVAVVTTIAILVAQRQ